jgi:hypothetical protein
LDWNLCGSLWHLSSCLKSDLRWKMNEKCVLDVYFVERVMFYQISRWSVCCTIWS